MLNITPNKKELNEIALKVGADVPFFLINKLSIGTISIYKAVTNPAFPALVYKIPYCWKLAAINKISDVKYKSVNDLPEETLNLFVSKVITPPNQKLLYLTCQAILLEQKIEYFVKMWKKSNKESFMRKIVYGLDEIKLQITNLKGQNVKMHINRGRKKIESVNAVIKDVYPSVFTIKTDDEKLQTFSYFDVMCGNVVLNQ